MSPLLRRLRRWWAQDRIRLSAAELHPDIPQAGDRLVLGRREFRLLHQVGSHGHRFEAFDGERGTRLTIELRDSTYYFEPIGSEPWQIPRQDVLLFPVSETHSDSHHSDSHH